jgi:hypothetical protein
MRRRRLIERARGLLALFCAALPACAAGPSFDGTLYRGQGVSFQLSQLPASWHRVSLSAADLAFRDEAHDASILVNSRCLSSDRDAPLVALTGHLLIGTTHRNITLEETVPFDGREARHTVLGASLDGVPMAYDIFVLKKDGCVYDFVHVAPPNVTAGTPEFDQFVHGFHTVAGPG